MVRNDILLLLGGTVVALLGGAFLILSQWTEPCTGFVCASGVAYPFEQYYFAGFALIALGIAGIIVGEYLRNRNTLKVKT